jgi:diguanylate cyclase (GGDEF)-like protein
MPDVANAAREEHPGRVPGAAVSTRPRAALELLREAIAGDQSAGLAGPRAPLLAVLVTAFYVMAAAGLAHRDVAVSFAIVPLVVAALTLAPRLGTAVAIVTFATVVVAEALVPGHGFGPIELVELIAFAIVSLALRLGVVRLARGRDETTRTAAELASTRAQVDEAREATERWVAQLEVAQRAAARMAGRPSVREVAEAVADEIRAIVDYHACRVYVVEEPDALVPIVAAGENGYETIALEDLALQVGEGFTGWVAANGRPLLVPDANADPRGMTIPGTDEIEESMVVVPMRYDDRVTGVITLSKLGLRQFDLADLRILSILADQAATAVESAKAISSSAALAEDLRRLADLSSSLSRSLDPLQVANLIAQHVGRAFGADECVISSWDRSADRLLTQGLWPPQRLDAHAASFALAGFPETRRVLQAQTLSMVDTEDPTADPAEVELLRRDGQRSLVMVPLVAKGETIGLVELCGTGPLRLDARRIDLAWAMASEAAMALSNAQLYETTRALADRDPLTGFYNHRYLHERLGEEILRAQRSRSPLSVLMIDLDDFKMVNDTLGHLFGDEVLRWAAEQIRSALRGSDVAARYGGDEFAVLLPDTPAPGAREVGERIVATLVEHPYRAPGRGPVAVAASVGVATFPTDGQTAQALVAGADAALYRVKSGGGRGVEGRVRRRPGIALPDAPASAERATAGPASAGPAAALEEPDPVPPAIRRSAAR